MAKIRFGKIKVKQEDGSIKTDKVAYADVTKVVKNLFDNVKKAYLLLGTYYGSQPEEEWQKLMESRLAVKDSDMDLDVDATTLYVKFISGKEIEFNTSEWGSISSCKNMVEFE